MLPVQFVQVQSTSEVGSQYEGVTDALQSRVHETRVAQVVEACGTSLYWHYTAVPQHTPVLIN